MTTSTITIRTEKEIKEAADELFDELGMTTSTAINIFLRKAIRTHRIPFEVGVSYKPNAELRAIIEEARRDARDPNRKGYTDIKQMFEDILAEEDNDEE